MGQSRVTDASGEAAIANAGRPRRYRVVFERVQVFTEEVEVEADTAGQAQVEAERMIEANELGRLEFQDLKSTEYRVSTVWSVS